MADDVDLDRALDELFTTPPEDFVAARNGLAKALKAAGQKDDAAEVTALRKPTRLVWAVDQLALTDDPTLAPLLEAAEAVREGGGDDLREAIGDLREAVNAAASAAAGRLETRPTDRADLAAALLAVVADEDATDDLTRGRLLEVPAPDAFGLGLAAPAPRAAPKKAPAKTKKAAASSDRPPDQLAIRRATKRQKEAAKEADAASRALARAEKTADAEDDALEEADEETARATTAVSEAETALAQAKADLDRAEEAAAQAVDTRDRAAALLAEAHERAEAAAAELDEATTELEELEA